MQINCAEIFFLTEKIMEESFPTHRGAYIIISAMFFCVFKGKAFSLMLEQPDHCQIIKMSYA